MRKIAFFYLFSLLFSALFYGISHVDISDCRFDSNEVELPFVRDFKGNREYDIVCSLDSVISQRVLFGIVVDDTIRKIRLNGTEIDLTYNKEKYSQNSLDDWKTGYEFMLPLKSGSNTLQVTGYNKGGSFSVNIAQSIDYVTFILFFVFGLIPFFYASFLLFFYLIERSKLKLFSRSKWHYLPFLIIAIGVILRVYLLINVDNSTYQHDFKGHKNAILYYADNGIDMPQANKNLQFPQQPLYYLISAQIYNISEALGYSENDSIYIIRSFSVFYALLWMLAGYLLVRLFTKDNLYVSMFIAFLALTPSFVFLGARVNNDSLNALFGMAALYLILSYFKHPTARSFFGASTIIVLAVLTKISSLLFALLFLMVLFLHYFSYSKESSFYFKTDVIKKRIFGLSLAILFVFGLSLVKVYIPVSGEFKFVNSYLYANQVIPSLDIFYFFTFNWLELIREAQSYVFGADDVRFSLFTYQYGTLFTGEYYYGKFYKPGTFFKLSTQLIYLFGIIYVIGLAAYIYFFKKLRPIVKLLIVPVLINAVLIVKFLISYWDVCNSDFRYYSPVFGAIGLIFVLGLKEVVGVKNKLKYPLVAIAVPFYISQIYWIVYLANAT